MKPSKFEQKIRDLVIEAYRLGRSDAQDGIFIDPDEILSYLQNNESWIVMPESAEYSRLVKH
ncbi:hypothetical protein PN836_011340 [Ningiella sp. W23]|uniref:hypothetical protein n=1 Tax=Ningiella sp. W23 TaxID=3023715 RepID=UPI003757353A